MKRILTYALALLFFLALLALLLFKLFAPNRPDENPPQDHTQFPIATDHAPQDQNTEEMQQLRASFLRQIDNAQSISLQRAKIVYPYALQDWGDENKGGEALLKHDDVTSGWQLIDLGGGAWDLESLVAAGVPEDIARQLIGP
jgi:hypothetical protein